jgi:hypothetical protein
MDLPARQAITGETIKRWQGRAFAWGTADCARLVLCHLKRCGARPALGTAGTWRSALGAARALGRAGFANLGEALDAVGLPRIAPAFAMIGDVVQLPSPDRFEALGIVLGNGRVLAWIEGADDHGCTVLQPLLPPLAAWRVPV